MTRFDRNEEQIKRARETRERIIRRYRPLWAHSYPGVSDGWLPIVELLCKKLERDAGGRVRMWLQFILWHTCQTWNGLVYRAIFRAGAKDPTKAWEKLLLRSTIARGIICFSDAKEKWGRLTLSGSFTERMWKRIDAAERLSQITCEDCGGRGYMIQSGWWHVTCAKHANESERAYINSLKTGLQRAIDKLS